MKTAFVLTGLALTLVGVIASAPVWADAPRLELKDGDRVAFIGNTFVEREAVDDYIETMLLTRYPGRNITFRNLGYSGDTTTGEARGLCGGWGTFEGPAKAFERLRKLVAEWRPTVLLINYGLTESFFGPAKIEDFQANYRKMLDALSVAAGGSPRFVLLTPNFHEDLGRPLPDPAVHNENLRLYADAIGRIAAERGCVFVDLLKLSQEASKSAPLTWNGIHFTPYGYWRIAAELEQSLGLPSSDIELKLTAGVNELTATAASLPLPPPPNDAPAAIADGSALPAAARLIGRIPGLSPGQYVLLADGQPAGKASAAQWGAGVPIHVTLLETQVEALRRLIVAKDFDYFNYERPENDSYLLAFRKREQGRNAVEIPQFLPFVEEKERQISEQRTPAPVKYTLQAIK